MLATRMRGAHVTTLGLGPPRYSGRDSHHLPIPLIPQIRAGVQQALRGDRPVSQQDGETLKGGNCV
jgi:hypothetical protein